MAEVAKAKKIETKTATKTTAVKSAVVVSAASKNVLSSPHKLRLIADMIRRKNAVKAVEILTITNKKAAQIMLKSVKSCIANAENNFNLDPKSLYITRILVNEGIKLPRFQVASRGRVNELIKRRATILIEMTEKK